MSDGDREHLLQAIASTAVKMLSPALHAGLTIFSRGELTPRASTGEAPLLLDRLQQELGDGPCINAARHQSIFRIEDTGRDRRWPQFNAEAARLNVRSMLCVPLWIDERSLGALSLYAGQVAAFTDLHERITILLATFAAPALAEAQRAGQLQEALGNRDVIGRAKGILMERHSITADTAFGVLSRVSQAENMKLAEIVRHLTETGKLPGASSPDSLADRRNPPSRHRGYHAQRDRRLSSGSKRGTSPYPGAGLRARLGSQQGRHNEATDENRARERTWKQ